MRWSGGWDVDGWEVTTSSGSAASLHDRLPSDALRRAVWVHSVTTPALVLGSTQPEDQVRAAVVRRAGIDLCRRRSGGGAVLVRNGDTWIDVLIGRDDPLWSDDVAHAFAWLGRTWMRTLAAAGLDRTTLHTGRLSNRAPAVCFAGVGPGEVIGEDRTKLVGMSQRRTRMIARFQTMVPSRQPLEDTLRYLDPAATAGIDPDRLVGVAVRPEVLVPAFVDELSRHRSGDDEGELDRAV